MSNTKISALTGATTPLAGTEVLPIVQSGATVKVSVANLTAGRAIDATTGTFTGLLTSSTGPATVSTLQGGLKSFCPGFSGQYGGIFFSTPSASIDQIEADIYTSGNTGVPSSKLKVLKDGDVNVLLGNLVIGTAAKGINFTANTPQAGMTSQLLNWYEEGTYVATLTPATSGTIPLNSLYDTLSYTKVGRVVTVQGQIQTLNPVSPVGSYFALNLPFTPVDLPELAGRGGTVINYEYTSVVATWEEGTANIYIWKNATTVLTAQNLFLSFTYFAA
jgi:hypothetical protein